MRILVLMLYMRLIEKQLVVTCKDIKEEMWENLGTYNRRKMISYDENVDYQVSFDAAYYMYSSHFEISFQRNNFN